MIGCLKNLLFSIWPMSFRLWPMSLQIARQSTHQNVPLTWNRSSHGPISSIDQSSNSHREPSHVIHNIQLIWIWLFEYDYLTKQLTSRFEKPHRTKVFLKNCFGNRSLFFLNLTYSLWFPLIHATITGSDSLLIHCWVWFVLIMVRFECDHCTLQRSLFSPHVNSSHNVKSLREF